ncbi:DinB family protein [Litoribacter populi]|uniref:DinB family protein n=1 Tax=Litoribacter populi TaxID=2598460 RepID=UPI00117E4261|nr:DinB family protein [Litoribacter populi]
MKTFKSLIFLGLFFGSLIMCSPVHAQLNMEEFLTKWENSKEYTLEIVDKMPEDKLDFRFDPESRTFKEQIVHLAGAIAGLGQGFLEGEDPGFETDIDRTNKDELKEFVANCFDYGKTTFENLSEEQMDERIDTFAGNITRRQMVGLISDHVTHHRGAAIAYLRANGIAPPQYRAL